MDSLDASLAPGGLFGICTFAAGRMGTGAPDDELLCHGRLHGGVGYTLDELREMFCWLDIVDAGPMPAAEAVGESAFSQDLLNVALFHRKHGVDPTTIARINDRLARSSSMPARLAINLRQPRSSA